MTISGYQKCLARAVLMAREQMQEQFEKTLHRLHCVITEKDATIHVQAKRIRQLERMLDNPQQALFHMSAETHHEEAGRLL
jgi:hypothetical protein